MCIPQPNGAVVGTCAGEGAPIRTEGDTSPSSIAAFFIKRLNLFLSCDIPKGNSFVATCAGEGVPIRTEGNAVNPSRIFFEGSFVFSRVCIPQADSAIVAAASEGVPIRTEGKRTDLVLRSFKRFRAFACDGIPQRVYAGCSIPEMDIVVTGTSEGAPIRTKDNALDTPFTRFERFHILAGMRIPQLNSPRTPLPALMPRRTGTSEGAPIRTKDDARDTRFMPFESFEVFSAVCIPKSDSPILKTCARKRLPIGIKDHQDRLSVPSKCPRVFPGVCVPQPDGFVSACSSKGVSMVAKDNARHPARVALKGFCLFAGGHIP